MGQKALELLAPAKNLEYGMAAINHGADAVYIGAEEFGARRAAGNSVEDIERLVKYAHQYHARVYTALNTILFDRELEAARRLIQRLWNAGVDALIIQDMGLLEMDLPPIPLFASTQVDNRTPEKVAFLEAAGFQRVILARELSLDDIRAIGRRTQVALEAFVHGALCVSYSGQCYMSCAMGGRSANRGACAQSCRLPWTLVDGEGKALCGEKYLLSLKDMDRSGHIPALADAGITSFKIEGRLKDISYVKNITAYYRQKLDGFMEGSPAHCRASSGKVTYSFTPNPRRTFYRGGTDYFLSGKGKRDIHSMDTPKSMGEEMGRVTSVTRDHFSIQTHGKIVNGDGLCFLGRRGKLLGLKVNRVDGKKILPANGKILADISKGVRIFRNHDHAFARALAGESARRCLGLDLIFDQSPTGFVLEGQDEDGNRARVTLDMEKISAKKPDAARVTLEKQLGKLGNTLFYLRSFTLACDPYFIPTRALNQLRRDLVAALIPLRGSSHIRREQPPKPLDPTPYPSTHLDFRANVANERALEFYKKHGVKTLDTCFELDPSSKEGPVMTLRHCIRHALGRCPRDHGSSNWPPTVFLENSRGRFRMETDCKLCEMRLLQEKSGSKKGE